jgi:hypothetical protein
VSDGDFFTKAQGIVNDATDEVLDRIDNLRSREGVSDDRVSKALKDMGCSDLAEAWDNYVIEPGYIR